MRSPLRKFLAVCVFIIAVSAASSLGAASLAGGLVPYKTSGRQVATVVFWSSALVLTYVLIGYPLVIAGWAALKPRPWRRSPLEPSVSIVIAAHNEAANIKKKITNLLALDYPADRLEILVGSDGSSDGTLERLRSISASRIRIFDLSERRGKPTVLNMLVPKASGEIVVLADVRQQFDPQLLRTLVQSFADPSVGAVSGELMFTRDSECTTVGDGTGRYWQYEEFIRCRESRIDSTIGATGPVYAIRKSLFEPIPADTILDDVLIPVRIIRRGYRVVFEPRARASVLAPVTAHEEFTRKVRTLAGNFQLLSREDWLLSPIQNRLWWQTISHKALRLAIPLFQLALFAANLSLAGDSDFYRIALIAQILFYSGAIVGWLRQHSHKRFWPATFPFMFCLLSWATVVGFLRCITGRQTVRWEKVGSSAGR
jgi:biofilm PGA synthesis N-glycosyltransferase PgaC